MADHRIGGDGAGAEGLRPACRGKTVGWFRDGCEFGPRALGHRSILAHPGTPGIPVLLNTSLNRRGIPIVETPLEAVALFAETPLDALVLQDVLVVKI
jgi:predicted NodU family carbamoyl transferase